MKSPTDKGFSNVRKNSRCRFVQNETRSDARKRTKSAPNVRQMFARRTRRCVVRLERRLGRFWHISLACLGARHLRWRAWPTDKNIRKGGNEMAGNGNA